MRIGRGFKLMKKWLIMIASIFLFACSTTEEPSVESEELSLKRTMDIAKDLTEQLLDTLEENIQDETALDAKQLQKIWSNYATTHYLEKAIIQSKQSESCTDSKCGIIAYFPLNFLASWEPEVEIITNEQFRLSGLFPISDEQSQKIELEAIFDDEQWKINDITAQSLNIDVQSEEVMAYLYYVYELEITEFNEVETRIHQQQEPAYQFVNPQNNEQYILIAKTGVLLPAADVE